MWRTEQAEERLLVQYLLGKLPEEKLAEVEDRAFADKSYLAALQAAEADLIDAYVRGELTGQERRDFEHRFLASPSRRKKVEFARAMARLADETPALPVAERSSTWWWQWYGSPRFAFALAGLICVASVSWLVVKNRAIESRVTALQSRTSDLEQQAQGLRNQLAEEQARSSNLAAQLKDPSPPLLMASLVLLPGISRAQSGATSNLILNAGTQLARIEVQLDAPDDYPRFRAELRTTGGDEVLTLSDLRRRRTAGGFAVSLDVPASVLTPGQYELALKGVASNGSAKEIGYYYFRVRRN